MAATRQQRGRAGALRVEVVVVRSVLRARAVAQYLQALAVVDGPVQQRGDACFDAAAQRIGAAREEQADGLDVALPGGCVQGLHRADGPIALAPSATGSGLALSAQADGLQVLFADGRCLRAGGMLQVEAEGAAIPGDTLQLAGPARCEGGEARIDLAPAPPTPGQPEVRADARFSADGGYRASVRVVSQDPRVIAALALTELQPGRGGRQPGGRRPARRLTRDRPGDRRHGYTGVKRTSRRGQPTVTVARQKRKNVT